MYTRLLWVVSLVCFFIACSNQEKNKMEDDQSFKETAAISQQIKEKPNDASLYFKRGLIYRSIEQDSLALSDFYQAVKLDSTKANYHSAIGELMFDHKDITSSVKWIQKAIELNPKDEIAHLKMANLFMFTEEYPKAFVEINTVLRQNVYNAEAYFLKGMCYKGLKDTNRAISSFQTAVQTEPKYVDAHMQLALIYERRKDEMALSYFENAYQADTSDLSPLYGKAMFWQNQNKFEEAKKIFTRMVSINRQYPKSYYNMGWMLLQEDSTEKAIRQFNIAIEVKPDYADAYFNRGLCYEIQQEYQNAIHDYNQAINFNQDNNNYQIALKRATQKTTK
jgi:tetratricopeptide (TPR) repeat protein